VNKQLEFDIAVAGGRPTATASAGFNREMLILARDAKGFTQKELANELGCAQSRLSKIESGELTPVEGDFEKLVGILEQNREFFFQQGSATPASVSFYRKKLTLPLKVLQQCNAQMNVRRLEIERQVAGKRLADRDLPFLPPEQNGGVEAVAQAIRREWNIPPGPIQTLTRVVEKAGCVVIDYVFPSSKLDGLSIRSPGRPPVIFLNRDLPKSRRRMSLAHELGHIVMHKDPHEHVEDEAWDFAAEFLMPRKQIGQQFESLNLDRLGRLKSEWGVSMQALLYRATKLEKIRESYSRFLWMQIGKYGYRVNEPFEDAIPDERPTELAKRLNTECNGTLNPLV
jgi:Zn-dependent peptidase ImmA (M78 family)